MSIFGNFFKISTFGESHSNSVGVIIEKPQPNIIINIDKIQKQLNRRRPGKSHITTPRNELDIIEIISGCENNITLGSPLTIIVKNKNIKKEDYIFSEETYIPRPSHADFTYIWKYGIHASSGGGRSSARETIGRVIAGTYAEQILDTLNIKIIAFVSQVGDKILKDIPSNLSRDLIDKYITRCPDNIISQEIEELITKIKNNGDSVGGKITCIVKNCPKGLGEPCFDKTEALLAHAMLSIPATKGFEIGSGFNCINQTGTQHNDLWINNNNNIETLTNNNGGIIGGITNGQDIIFSVAFKPPATVLAEQPTVDINGNNTILKANGRHDPCVVPRAVPIVESMTAIVLLELYYNQLKNLNNIK